MLLVMSCAIPRPAIINTSVATIGWMRPYETSTPFHTPHSVAMTMGTMITAHRGIHVYCGLLMKNLGSVRFMPTIVGFIMTAAIEALMAMIAPTDRSTPPVAMTSVIPIARIMVGDPCTRISITLP